MPCVKGTSLRHALFTALHRLVAARLFHCRGIVKADRQVKSHSECEAPQMFFLVVSFHGKRVVLSVQYFENLIGSIFITKRTA